jgi:outer membrane lipoprotein-sorting protein
MRLLLRGVERDRRGPARNRRGGWAGTICAALFALAAMAAPAGAADSPHPEAWLREAEAAYAGVTSYTAIFHKQQRVAGELLPKETILLKFRKPSSFYMKWIESPYKGSELLYAEGWNAGRARVHRGGLLRFITHNLDPRDPGLMADNLRPFTSAGIGFLVDIVAINLRKAIRAGELEFFGRGTEEVYGRRTQVLEAVFPKEKSADYDGHRFVINQDVESKILVRIRVYDRDGQLVENYGYENLALGAPLTDADFDPKNPKYRF